ncbi:hypothetical protein AB6809_29500 [Paraburkholderia sp. RCC_158]|uniref:hypothetical protein n=1 Tax=Paraburkholderia sp. RCC_158 TaxID=3239220 RepID=UPI003523CAE7
MSITYEEILATVDTSEHKLSADPLAHCPPQVLDNLYLDHYGFVIDQFHNHDICAASVGMVYAAAKVIFARGPQEHWIYDLDSASSEFGSPWESHCKTPEDWAVCFARRLVETTDANVEDDDVTEEVVQRAIAVLDILKRVGMTAEQVHDLRHDVCYSNEKLVRMLDAALIA